MQSMNRNYTAQKLMFIGSIALCFIGYFLSILNTTSDLIFQEFEICGKVVIRNDTLTFNSNCIEAKQGASHLNYIFFMSAALGSLSAQKVMDKLGRRKAMMSIFFIICIGQYLSFQIINIRQLLILRFLIGIACGLATVVAPVYITEMAPMHLKDFANIIPAIAVSSGSFLAIFPANFIRQVELPSSSNLVSFTSAQFKFASNCWKTMLFLPCPIAGISFLSLYYPFAYETPTYLKQNDYTRLAQEVELHLFGENKQLRVKSHIFDKTQNNHYTTHITSETVLLRVLDCISDFIRPIKNHIVKFNTRLISNSSLRVGWTLAVLQQFSGITVYMSMSRAILNSFNLTSYQSTYVSSLLALSSVVCAFISPFIMQYTSRKSVLVHGYFFMSIAHLFCTLSLLAEAFVGIKLGGALICFSILIFFIIYGVTIGPILFLYLNELYPSEIKSVGLAVSFFANWTACLIIMFILETITTDYVRCLILFVACIIGTVYSHEMAPETRITSETTEMGQVITVPDAS